MPTGLEGAAYIKTWHGDRTKTGSTFLTFDVNLAVTVYIAHSDRITTKPSWLASFTDTGEDILVSNNGKTKTLSIFTKDYLTGTITLGGNEGPSASRMYTVIIVKN